jgi:hypothetical protein
MTEATSKIQFTTSGELLPQNERTEKLLEARRSEEMKRKKEEDERRLKFEKEDRERRKKEKSQKKMKEQQAKQEADKARRQLEEEQERSRLDGKINIISQHLRNNTSPGQYSLSGIELSQNTVGILCNDISPNKTLKCLHLSKKKITDAQGVKFAEMLIGNTCLIKLELEGNVLGPKTALEFGKVLKDHNRTLRYLDMENNYLTNSGATYDEIKTFSDCLLTNKTLLHLNLGNNGMIEECGERFVQSTDANKTLICFEFGFNNFLLEQIRAIKTNLLRNKAAYDDERFREWKERKRMAEEERAMRILVTAEQKDDIMKDEAEKSRIAREKARDAAWKEFLMESELDKQRLIQRLEEAAKMRKSRPKKKGRKGKKKK